MSTDKLGRLGRHLDIVFWVVILVSMSVFGAVFSPYFWMFVAISCLIQSCLRLMSKE